MALVALTSETVTVNSVDYSDHIKQATVVVDVNQLDSTTFGSGGWTEYVGGLKAGTLSIEFLDDFADNDLDEELWTILGTVVAFTVKPTSASVGAGNPNYTGNVLISTHTLGGTVGELAAKSITWPTSGAITRAVA